MSTQNQLKKQINLMSFEEALQELEQIVASMESGQIPLDETVKSYEKGILLKQHCEKKLQDAQQRITQLNVNKDGDVDSITEKESL